VVSEIVDKVVLIVRWGSTARALVRQCVGRLSGHGKVAGVAFNRVNERQAKKYGEDAHSDYYGNRYYKDYYTH
jgi:Mrp family chromosome partitioning ATPase